MRLTYDPSNEMGGRDGFFIHADSYEHPGQASEGCIVLPLQLRMMIALSLDRDLSVIAGSLPTENNQLREGAD